LDNSVGIVKELDMLGRLVIPKEFRERFGLTEKVELVATEEGVLLRSLEYRLVKIENDESK
jgi:AbrB family looped-hinge helix DNA binding protein